MISKNPATQKIVWDGKVHITPANLSFMPHRFLEYQETMSALKSIFQDPNTFYHHSPLPNNLPDEGAANHMRLFFKEKSLELFVYGRQLLEKKEMRYPARHPLESSLAIVRLHGLREEEVVFIRQSEEAINAGAFHNDVVATSFETFLLFHEKAFAEKDVVIKEILKKTPYTKFYEVKDEHFSLKDAVSTYLFNSQIVRTTEGKRLFLAPQECQKEKKASDILNDLLIKGFIDEIAFISLSESMHNGGGPACLRLRIPLSEEVFAKVNPNFLLNEFLYVKLTKWINHHFRDELTLKDIPDLLEESNTAINSILSSLKNNIYIYKSLL